MRQLLQNAEVVGRRCSVEKVFKEIFKNSMENTCARVSFLIKNFIIKKRLWHRCFPVNFAKFLRTPSFTEHLRWLLLKMRQFITKYKGYYKMWLLLQNAPICTLKASFKHFSLKFSTMVLYLSQKFFSL